MKLKMPVVILMIAEINKSILLPLKRSQLMLNIGYRRKKNNYTRFQCKKLDGFKMRESSYNFWQFEGNMKEKPILGGLALKKSKAQKYPYGESNPRSDAPKSDMSYH